MSLKRMAMGLAIAFAARKGYGALQRSGGLAGLKRSLSGGGGLSGALGGRAGQGGGLGGLLGGLGGGAGGAGMGGLLGGLAAMAGGSAMAGASDDDRMARAEAGIEDEATARAMIRAMAMAVQADGRIDADERRALDEALGDGDPGDRDELDAALAEPVDAEGLARSAPVGSEAQVYAAALTAIDPDHPAERTFLSDFARALRLPEHERRALHDAQGKPA